jgi:hypothetical protein
VPWPVYTERLITTAVTGVWVPYTVPGGMRAIIKSCMGMCAAGAPGKVHVVCANEYVAAFALPELYTSRHADLLHVAYAGDVVRVFIEGTAGAAAVNGWVLADASGRSSAPPAPATDEEWPPPPSASTASIDR